MTLKDLMILAENHNLPDSTELFIDGLPIWTFDTGKVMPDGILKTSDRSAGKSGYSCYDYDNGDIGIDLIQDKYFREKRRGH